MVSATLCALALASTSPPTSAGLIEDAQVLRRALVQLHPGFTRYRSARQEQAQFDELVRNLSASPDTPKAYAAFSKYLAGIRCGHTFLNPYNQVDGVLEQVYGRPDKLPFLAEWVDRSLIVTRVPAGSPLRVGDAVLKIADSEIGRVYRELLARTRADGGRDNTRRRTMSLNDAEYNEADALLPTLLPYSAGEVSLLVERDGKRMPARVATVSLAERNQRLGLGPVSYDNWSFEMRPNGLGVLRIPHFITWKMKSNWRTLLVDSIGKLRDQPGSALLIDLRGCEGGSTDPLPVLASQLLSAPLRLRTLETRTAFEKVPDDLRPRVNTWDDSVFDLSKRVQPRAGGGYTVKPGLPQTYRPQPGAFRGPVYVAIDAANSSGGFLAAWLFKETGRVTLIGEETGGSRRGINAGQMFFLRLPNSEFRVDVPIYATFPLDKQPERGIVPDIRVPRTRASILLGTDPVVREVERRMSADRQSG